MIKVHIATLSDLDQLARMCVVLWPHATFEEESTACRDVIEGRTPGTMPAVFLVAQDESGTYAGFAEVSIRSHADGCDPAHAVGFLEGWFVEEPYRRSGVGRALLQAAEDWARGHGCIEFASDALIDNDVSLTAHQALGFEIVDRCVHFRKPL